MKNLTWFLLFFALVFPQFLFAQQTRYTLTFPNAVHHEAYITVVFEGVQTPVLEARMTRSSPGRYALHEFAKNVYAFNAENSKGEALQISRPNPHQWNVSGHDGTVKITYTLFGDRTDGTYASIDETHAHLNAPATFMYASGFEEKPSFVNFQVPEGKNWTVATQLKPETNAPQAAANPKNAFTYSAPNLQYLMDSPTELADFKWQEWPVTENGKTQIIRFAAHHTDPDYLFAEHVFNTTKVVEEARKVFGEFPTFDYGTYTFIACYMPQAASDGMEHRNSTILTSARKTNSHENLGTVSHEFFHAWNVERIRPQNLEPFNFAEANMSDALWFAEGFTSYYGDLLLVRSGAVPEETYFKNLASTLNYFLFLPGKDLYSPAEMSLQAPFVDAARSVDNTNRLNTYVSHYTHGEVLGLALDLTLRANFPGITLDNYMQTIWQKYGKTGKFYTLKDLEQTLAEVTKNEPFASEFFQKHIYGHAAINFRQLLSEAGLELKLSHPNQASLGHAPLNFSNGKATMLTGPVLGSPLYLAGVENEDVLLKLDGKKLSSNKALEALLKKHKPGDKVMLEFGHRGQKKTVQLTLIEDPTLEIVSVEKTGKPLSEKANQFRQQWLK